MRRAHNGKNASSVLPGCVPKWEGNGANAKMTLATRLAIAMVLLVAIAVSAVGWLSYRSVEQVLLPRILDRIETHSRLVATDLESYVAGARGDIAGYRSAAALQGLMRAHLAGGNDSIDQISESTWRERMAARLAAELDAKPAYAEFRIIGVEDGGREIIKADRLGPSGAVRLAPEAELRRMGDKAYFADTIKLPPDELYISALDLMGEDG
ncbi:MAG: PAS domain S-box protein, partial [Xanthobacteraceae bacterium]